MRSAMTLLFGLLVLLAGCEQGAPECVDNGGCPEGQACIEDQCEEVECVSSSQCSLHQFCDTKAWVCRQGCGDDDDCRAGETCDAADHKCKRYGCRDTQLDCEIGEVCDEGTGECTVDPRKHCTRCDPMEELLGTQPCGPKGYCWLFEQNAEMGYCLQQCNQSNDNCPRGFTCEDVTGYGDFYCSAWCPLLLENGWI